MISKRELEQLHSEPGWGTGQNAQAVFRYGLNHHVLMDEALVLADELGLPTRSYDGTRAYERVTFIARGGVVRHVFGGGAGGRAAGQALAWLAVHASGGVGLDAG